MTIEEKIEELYKETNLSTIGKALKIIESLQHEIKCLKYDKECMQMHINSLIKGGK